MKSTNHPIDNLWTETQDEIADKNGMAVIFVKDDSSVVLGSNNNSICQNLYSSEKFSPECDKYCGRAFRLADEAGTTVEYKCYAGLVCRAVPVRVKEKIKFVAIVGRTFTQTADYRRATERAISGDWEEFSPTGFFENVLLNGSDNDLAAAVSSIENLDDEGKAALVKFAETKQIKIGIEKDSDYENTEDSEASILETRETNDLDRLISQFHESAIQPAVVTETINEKNSRDFEIIAAWRSLFGSLLVLSYRQACDSILSFISEHYALKSLAWLERKENRLITVLTKGKLSELNIQINISTEDERLKEAIQNEISLEMRERDKDQSETGRHILQLFPIAVGGEIRSGLIAGDKNISVKTKRHIVRFCHNIASELEVLRLREEVTKRGWLTRAVQKFNENLSEIDSEDFWLRLIQTSAELMKAERSSLLLFDEKSDTLVLKAAIGSNADAIKNKKGVLGERVARLVLDSGKSLVVTDIDKIGLQTAPAEWRYKSKSFISYPLTIGARKIGVLNLTDKTDGEIYNELDLELLKAIVPQFAVLIDRAALKHKAGEFEQLSVTDALTGLLNRRYLEERLAEEIKRSNRHGFPMSFMMIDVDDFKSYNDNFSHPEGDKALKLVAFLLKDTLRGADIAARYGGEEFSILLPQTTTDEAKIIADRIREKVESTSFPNRQVTISVGIASCSEIICNAQEIIAAADKALYSAKKQGRNNVQIFEEINSVVSQINKKPESVIKHK